MKTPVNAQYMYMLGVGLGKMRTLNSHSSQY